MSKIINHDCLEYRKKWSGAGSNRYNGAFYYSKEICKNIIPNVDTDRNWITVNVKGVGCDHAVVFIHNNLHPENYDWLADYDDLILVCGVPETCEKVAHLGTPIYLPLSIDVEYVEQFKVEEKTKDTAFVGRWSKARYGALPKGIDYICGLKRQKMLPIIAQYEKVFAVGRCALEAIALDCEVLPYDDRFPDPSVWKVWDNREAAKMLQDKLDAIDGRNHGEENE